MADDHGAADNHGAAVSRVLNGRYKLAYKLGAGGMGSVWLAEDQLLERSVALKELMSHTGMASMPDRRARVVQEARALARVRHPSIVPIHDVFFVKDDPWIVMEYISGRSLADIIKEESLDERSIARIGLHVLRGLIAVHKAGVVHRDVKPTNILVADDGSIFLVDFGIARIAGDTSLTGQSIVGTPDFIAPERFRASPKVGPAADIWALGVTFYFALEGYSPFWRESEGGWEATMMAILSEAPHPPGRGGRLSDVTMRMLHKDPTARADAEQVLAVLEEIVGAGQADPDPEPGRLPRTAKPSAAGEGAHSGAPVSPPGPGYGQASARRGQEGARDAAGPWTDGVQPPTVVDPARAAADGRDRPRPGQAAGSGGSGPRPRGGSRRARQPQPSEPETQLPPRGEQRGRAGNRGELPKTRDIRFADAREVIQNVGIETGVAMLLAMSEDEAARVLTELPSRLCGELAQGLAAARPATAATIFRIMRSTVAGRAFAYLRPDTAAELLAVMQPPEALRILDSTDERSVAAAIMQLPLPTSTALLKSMYSRQRAAQVLTHVRPATAAELLRSDSEFAAGVLKHLSEPVRKQVSRHLQARQPHRDDALPPPGAEASAALAARLGRELTSITPFQGKL